MKNLTPLFEDDNWIAFDKPSGLLSIPDRHNPAIPSLYKTIQQKHPEILLVHRLDKDTSGVMAFAKNKDAQRLLSDQLATANGHKIYEALVYSTPNPTAGTIDVPIGVDPTNKGKMRIDARGKASRTDYEVLESWKHFSHLKLQLFTGRTHQIRVHLKYLGHPIVCDSFYGDGQPFKVSSIKRHYNLAEDQENELPLLSRLALHATLFSFKGFDGEDIVITAPLPKQIRAMINQLNKWDRNND